MEPGGSDTRWLRKRFGRRERGPAGGDELLQGIALGTGCGCQREFKEWERFRGFVLSKENNAEIFSGRGEPGFEAESAAKGAFRVERIAGGESNHGPVIPEPGGFTELGEGIGEKLRGFREALEIEKLESAIFQFGLTSHRYAPNSSGSTAGIEGAHQWPNRAAID